MSKKKEDVDNNSTNNRKYKKEYKKDPDVDYSYIKRCIATYIANEHFYGRILSRTLLVEDWNVPTAYVTFDYESYKQTGMINYKIGYNPGFVHEELAKSYKDENGQLNMSTADMNVGKEFGFVLTHELLHLLLSHLTERNIFTTNKNDRMLVNIAMDLAINSLLHEKEDNKSLHFKVPEICFLPGRTPKTNDEGFNQLIQTLEPLKTTSFYYKKMKEYLDNRENKEGDGEGDDSSDSQNIDVTIGEFGDIGFDSHDGWDDLPREVREQIKSHMKAQIQEALNNAQKKGWGNCSNATMRLMQKIAAPPVVDWTKIIQNVVGQCRIQETESSYKKLNKKMPMDLPGIKRKYSSPIAFFIDQSGSMGESDVKMAFSEAVYASKEIQIDVFNFDTEVDQNSHQVWKKNGGDQVWKRTRDGGTDFNAIKRYLEDPNSKNKKNWKWIVIITDGYAPSLDPVLPRVLWLITENGKEPENVRPNDLVAKMKKNKYESNDY